ncbi:MAG: MlaD family protein [Prevotellaceae bacterium]|jgi:phospholipid/cholesterol/gamma-HCH transport system substrate-binding protein|nr:MlaD family protein [Prevotellaceae bacterium]
MKIKKELKIGIYLVITVAVLYWGLNFLRGKDIFGKNQKFYAVFENVQGLQQTSNVLIRGLKVGMIEKIVLNEEENNFIVTLRIDSKYNIPVGTRAVIYSVDLLGSKAIKLEFGNSDKLHIDGDTLAAGIEGDLTTVLDGLVPIKDKLNVTLDQVNTLLSSFNKVLNDKSTENLNKGIENFSNITESLNSIAKALDESIEEEKGTISKLLGNVEEFTDNLKGNNDKINTIISNLVEVSDGLSGANFGDLADNLNDIIRKLKEGEGSLGKALTNDSLYINLVNTTNSLNTLLKDLKENPGRYVQISVFGRKNKN